MQQPALPQANLTPCPLPRPLCQAPPQPARVYPHSYLLTKNQQTAKEHLVSKDSPLLHLVSREQPTSHLVASTLKARPSLRWIFPNLKTTLTIKFKGGVSTLAPNHTPRAAPVGHRPPPSATSDYDPRLPGPPAVAPGTSPYLPTFGHTPSPHGSTPASNSSSVGAPPLVGPPPAPAPGGAATLPPSGAPPAAALPSAPMVSPILLYLPSSAPMVLFLTQPPPWVLQLELILT